jgi:hypothetical protein
MLSSRKVQFVGKSAFQFACLRLSQYSILLIKQISYFDNDMKKVISYDFMM